MRFLKIIAKFLFILSFPPLLLTASIAAAVNCPWLYQHGFQKYHISQTTGIAEPELDKAASGLIRYFNSGEEYISLTIIKDGKPFPLFNEREIEHLKDVKSLFRLDYLVLLGTLAYVMGYWGIHFFRHKDRKRLAKNIFSGSVLTLALTLALGLVAVFDFNRFFLQFHLLSFTNDFWMLDPSRDYLIMLFPGGFWYDATVYIILGVVAAAVVLGGISGGYLTFTRRKEPGG